jgi:glutamate-5-semialdehyde dehydrogenase
MSDVNKNDQLIKDLARKARLASKVLAASSYEIRQSALLAIADTLEKNCDQILAANNEDQVREQENGISASLLDRLALNPKRVAQIAAGARQVAHLGDPLQRVLMERTLANGLELKQVSVPFGVVGMIYEARPNVTVDAAVILLISGNASLLRGSSSARVTNQVLVDLMREALLSLSLPAELVTLLPSEDRDTVRALLHARGFVDLVIPRGSAKLIEMVVSEAKVPTIETGAGVCHVYFDESADAKKAIPIIVNAKVQRPSVCNAAETLLVHRSRVKDLLPTALEALASSGVIFHCDSEALEIARSLGFDQANLADEENWSTEYGTLEINLRIVDSIDEALAHIERYGTRHTEAIVSEDVNAAQYFVAHVDCAAVMINASTRFTDGEEMGFGAEIGISNQKLHARGPMGIEAMTTTTWIVSGTGQIRE